MAGRIIPPKYAHALIPRTRLSYTARGTLTRGMGLGMEQIILDNLETQPNPMNLQKKRTFYLQLERMRLPVILEMAIKRTHHSRASSEM